MLGDNVRLLCGNSALLDGEVDRVAGRVHVGEVPGLARTVDGDELMRPAGGTPASAGPLKSGSVTT